MNHLVKTPPDPAPGISHHGAVAAPFISEILSARGAIAPVIPVKKEIACLITEDDLREIDCSLLEPTVIIPGRAFVHDAEAKNILSRDGTAREVIRGESAHCRCGDEHGHDTA